MDIELQIPFNTPQQDPSYFLVPCQGCMSHPIRSQEDEGLALVVRAIGENQEDPNMQFELGWMRVEGPFDSLEVTGSIEGTPLVQGLAEEVKSQMLAKVGELSPRRQIIVYGSVPPELEGLLETLMRRGD